MLETVLVGVLDVSLQLSLLLLLLFAADKFLSKHVSAQAKCWIWMICGIRLLLPVTFSFSMPQSGTVYVQESVNAALPMAAAEAAAQSVSSVPAALEPAMSFQAPVERLYAHITVLEGLAMVWAAAALGFLLVHLALYFLQTRFLRKNGKAVVDGEIFAQLEQVKAELHVTRSIRLLVSEKAESPLLIGLFHSILVLPSLDFSPEQLAVILRHEIAHCKRCDLPVKWLFLLVRSVHWFNPLVHILAKKADFDLESACDDTVLRGKDKSYRRQYGNVLLDILSEQKSRFVVSTHFSCNTKELVSRIRNIVQVTPKKRGLILLFLMAIITIALTSNLNPMAAEMQTIPYGRNQYNAQDTDILKKQLEKCLEGSSIEEYSPYSEVKLSEKFYNRCLNAERIYRSILLQSDHLSVAQEYAKNPSLLIIDRQSAENIVSGFFCCQTDDDVKKKDARIHLIWVGFSNETGLQTMDIGTVSNGRDVDQKIQKAKEKWNSITRIADNFKIDLSQYKKAFSETDPAIIENRAESLSGSLQKQLRTEGRYQFEQYDRNQMTAFIKKDNTEGVLINTDRSGDYIHYFEVPTEAERDKRKTLESQFPIIQSHCMT